MELLPQENPIADKEYKETSAERFIRLDWLPVTLLGISVGFSFAIFRKTYAILC